MNDFVTILRIIVPELPNRFFDAFGDENQLPESGVL
jgi:hypothetical protein